MSNIYIYIVDDLRGNPGTETPYDLRYIYKILTQTIHSRTQSVNCKTEISDKQTDVKTRVNKQGKMGEEGRFALYFSLYVHKTK